MIYSHRRQKALNLLERLRQDAFLFCQPDNIRYLCGFTGSDGALIVTADETVFLTDSRYTTQAGQEVFADQVVEYSSKVDGIVGKLVELGIGPVGFEADISFGFVSSLQKKCGRLIKWKALKDEFQGLRLHKSPEEIEFINTAAELNVQGLAAVTDMIRPGTMEVDIALALEFAMRKQGAQEKAFDIIVASGERGAMPHGVASSKVLAAGELVTIDFGCRVNGYHSDETVTVALGDVDYDLRKIYDIVLEAHDRAIAAVTPGIPLVELDRIARGYIEDCGYGEYFGHGLGHGVGLAIHEAPTVSPRSTLKAEEGMVFTVEPGIYVPGVGGVRIEDMVLVTANGHQVLTKIPKTFRTFC